MTRVLQQAMAALFVQNYVLLNYTLSLKILIYLHVC